MDTLHKICAQEWVEEHYDRKHIDVKIRSEINASTFMQTKIAEGITLITEYLNKPDYFASKQSRIDQLKEVDLSELVMDLFVGVAYCLKPVLFTSVSAQMSARLGFDDRKAAITTTAELLAVLCNVDAYDITKEDKNASLMLESKIPLSAKLVKFIEDSEYLPPMICEPLELTHNHSSGYLTHNDSLILGAGNHHSGDICLDVLNTINKVKLSLDISFLLNVDEEPTFELDTREKVDMWQAFKAQSNMFYNLMNQHGNEFYLTNKVDMRGRIYASGYHISTQGTAHKKAMVEFSKAELVEGVPV